MARPSHEGVLSPAPAAKALPEVSFSPINNPLQEASLHMKSLPYPSQQDMDTMRALVHQVSKATPKKGSEQDVVTFISAPLWKSWCRAVGIPQDSVPTGWGKDCHRVYGSLTVVVPSKALWAVSKARL